MNIKLRFKNRATLTAILACVIAFIYQMLGFLGIVPSVTENMMTDLVGVVIDVMVAVGIIVDPTTAGIGDSAQAMEYETPRIEAAYNDDPAEDPECETLIEN